MPSSSPCRSTASSPGDRPCRITGAQEDEILKHYSTCLTHALVGALLMAAPVFAQTSSAPAAPFYNGTKEYSINIMATGMYNSSSGWPQPQSYPTRVLEPLADFHPASIPMDKWGGRLDRSAPATGYFYMKQVDGRWWAVDPDGHLYVHRGVAVLTPGSSPNAKAALAKLYGTPEKWMELTQSYLVYNGFNGAGAWSATDLIRKSPLQLTHPLAYTINLDVMNNYGKQRGGLHTVPGHAGYPHDVIFVFDPGFAEFADKYLQRVAEYANDPALFGYYSDNEMPLSRGNLEHYLELPHDDAGYIAARQWMQDNHVQHIDDDARKRFLAFEIDRYASIVNTALRKYDPHHMYLGCRYTGETKWDAEAFSAMGKYADGISVNLYNTWTPDPKQLDLWMQNAHKPVIITEWYTKAADSGLTNKTGAGWTVRTQAERGEFYQNFTLALLQSKEIVGWHWFTYQDNDPKDPKAELSNLDANKGIVSINYQPYQPLLERMRPLNLNAYALIDYFDSRPSEDSAAK